MLGEENQQTNPKGIRIQERPTLCQSARQVAQAFDFSWAGKKRWVPRPLRTLQRAGTTNAYATGFM